MRRTELDRYREDLKANDQPTTVSFEGMPRFLLGDDLLPTQRRFMESSARIRGFMGPAGSGKTNTGACLCFMRALFQPGAKIFVCRHDYNDLLATTLKEFEKMLDRLPTGTLIGRDKSSPMRWWIRPAVENGVESEITFMGLKDQVVGVNAHVYFIDEANEVDEARIHEIDMRLRAPDSDAYVLALAFNPPLKTHWLYKACTGRNWRDEAVGDPFIEIFESQPRENEKHLPKGYYEERARGKPQDIIDRFVLGKWGVTFEGDPVYAEFNFNAHTRPDLHYDEGSPLLRFWDFGYNHPACVWAQIDAFGRMRFLQEELGSMEEATAFARRCLVLTDAKFQNPVEVRDYGDPAVRQHKDTGSTLAAFAREGILIRFKISKLMDGVDLVRQLLQRMAGGEPILQFSRKGCPLLINALQGGYRLDDSAFQSYSTLGREPKKDGFYDHLADALRYGVINTMQGGQSLAQADRFIPPSTEYRADMDQGRLRIQQPTSEWDGWERWVAGIRNGAA